LPWPAQALVEMPDYIAGRADPRKIFLYARAVGAAECALDQAQLPIDYVMASKYKENTRKNHAKERFRSLVGHYPETDDESDALCIGLD